MRAVLFAACLVLTEVRAQDPKAPVEIKTISYADLGKVIRSHKGKVVVVDIWATSCVPCKKEFPHLVELHEKHAGEGLVCISLSVDGSKAEAKALEFLVSRKATFANYRLKEGFEQAAEKFGFNSIPVVFVFNRENKRAMKFTGDNPDKPFDYEHDVTPLVRKLLKD